MDFLAALLTVLELVAHSREFLLWMDRRQSLRLAQPTDPLTENNLHYQGLALEDRGPS
jgi:hypothetical protein